MVFQEVSINVRLGRAAEILYDEFGPLMEAEYLPGKTMFRDALWSRFGLSQLQAEELCDSLEQAGMIRFISSDEQGVGWNIDVGPSEPSA